MSFDTLISKIISMKNPTVAGLDPKLDYVPEYLRRSFLEEDGETLKAASKAIFRYNQMLIDALCDIVPAVKLQAAYYEMYGHHGVKTMERTIRYAKLRGMYVITDGKRNDIGATMEAYASAHLGTCMIGGTECEPFGADALTVNGYLGSDGINPLLSVCRERGRGIFVLCKTSNPSSGEFQDLLIDGVPLYARMGDKCEEWGADSIGTYGYSAVGAVVGATYPEQLSELRARLPHTLFLVPGYGAQGGGAAGIAGGFDKNGLGAVVNSSRAILCAYKKEGCDERDFAGAARREALRMRDDITTYIHF
ncbi:MAG: orotidine-5'-phosphate decarboxylase [Oscillospiraceae bacterium]|nr:orotidine-5'-phosphate decarboxylase [Oscillospiraceae bacterium]MCR5306302.1 orotidine-5'-phosphate decarboxylase [Oscillospiraceae bacterium]